MSIHLKRWIARFDAGFALLIGLLSVWLIYSSQKQAALEVATFGRAVDAGAIAYAVAVVCCIPTAVLFAMAALSLLRNWRIGWTFQILAVGWVAVALAAGLTPLRIF